MSDDDRTEVRLGRGIVATVWRKHARGLYRACVTFPNGVQVSTVDFRFATIGHAHAWAKEVVAFLQARGTL